MENAGAPQLSCVLAPRFRESYKLAFKRDEVAPVLRQRCDAFGAKLRPEDKEELFATEFMLDAIALWTVTRDQCEDCSLQTKRVSAHRFRDETGEPFIIAHDIVTPCAASGQAWRKHRVILGLTELKNNNTLTHTALCYGIESVLYDVLHPEQGRQFLPSLAIGAGAGAAVGALVSVSLPEKVRLGATGIAAGLGSILEAGRTWLDHLDANLERKEVIRSNVADYSENLESWPISLRRKPAPYSS